MSPPDSHELRRTLVDMLLKRRAGHLGASNSALDIIAAAIIDVGLPPGQFVLSKGHAAPALYVILAAVNQISDLTGFRRLGSRLEGHPKAGCNPTIPASTGALGNGLGFTVGAAIARPDLQWVCVCSDGELQEGLSGEALRIAGSRRLANLTVVIDCNGWQASGPIDAAERTLWEPRIVATGCEALSVNGHDRRALAEVIRGSRRDTRVVLARTDRRHGLPFMRSPAEVYADRLTDHQHTEMVRFSGD